MIAKRQKPSRHWMFASGACMAVAGVLLLLRRYDAAFVAGTLGAVTWFLGYRSLLRRDEPAEEASEERRESEDEADA